MTRHVMHDGKRWRVVGDVDIDGEAGFELRRRIGVTDARTEQVIARARECEPDAHQARRVFRDADGALTFYPARGVIEVRPKRAREPFLTSIAGIIRMCARARASQRALERAFKRRTRRR